MMEDDLAPKMLENIQSFERERFRIANSSEYGARGKRNRNLKKKSSTSLLKKMNLPHSSLSFCFRLLQRSYSRSQSIDTRENQSLLLLSLKSY